MKTAALRPLDPAERYFALVDQLLPMNVLVTATFSRPVPVDAVRSAWIRLSESTTALRSRIDFTDPQVPTLVETAERAADFLTVSDLDMQTAMQIEQDTAFDLNRGSLARCRIGKPSGGPDYMLLTLSHALTDGRGGLGLLRSLIREIDSPGSVAPIPALHAPLHERLPGSRLWAGRRPQMIELLRTLKDERASRTPDPCSWHSRTTGTRRIRLTSTQLSEQQTSALLAVARAAETSVYGVLGAACLQQTHLAFDDASASRELELMSPVDLRRFFLDLREEDAVGMYTSMLSSVHPVTAGPITELSRSIAASLTTQIERGEGELFYALARCDRVPVTVGDGRWASESLAAAPASVALSNLGVIDDRDDPEWVAALSATLAPTPNQVLFVAATTYRGRVNLNVSVDVRSMSAQRAADFAGLGVLRSLVA